MRRKKRNKSKIAQSEYMPTATNLSIFGNEKDNSNASPMRERLLDVSPSRSAINEVINQSYLKQKFNKNSMNKSVLQ